MADYTSFIPWTQQIEALTPDVSSKSYRVSRQGRNVRLISADGEDEGMVAYINDLGTLGGSGDLVDRLRPILDGPTDEELAAQAAAGSGVELEVGRTTTTEPTTTTRISPTHSGSLAAFATSGKGGLRNDPNEGPAIRELQRFLARLGFDVGSGENAIDGRYGPKTTRAVRRFQELVGFTGGDVDGDAGPQTIAKIQEVIQDLEEIERLTQEAGRTPENSSYDPVMKSFLGKMLYEELSETDRARLQQLLTKYEDLLAGIPEDALVRQVFTNAQAVITPEVTQTEPEVRAEPQVTRTEPQVTRTEPEVTQTEPVATSAWEDITDGSAMIDGYSLWRKREAPRNYTYTVAGSEPDANAEEFRRPAEAIAAARRARDEASNAPAQEGIAGYIPNATDTYVQVRGNSNASVLNVENDNSDDEFYIGIGSDRQTIYLIDPGSGERREQISVTLEELQRANPSIAMIVGGWFDLTPFTDDLQQNMRTLLLSYNGSRVNEFLEAINLENKSRQEITAIRSSLRNLVSIILGSQRPPQDVNGGEIIRHNRSVQTAISNFIDNELMQASTTASPAQRSQEDLTTPEGKAQALYNAMAGVGVNRDRVTEIILSIQNEGEYAGVNEAFEGLSGGESLWSFIDSQSFFSTVRIEQHLRSINVTLENRILELTRKLLER